MRGLRRTVPAGAKAGAPEWQADGTRYASSVISTDSVELWIGEAGRSAVRRIEGVKLNPFFGSEIQWMPDQKALLVRTVRDVLTSDHDEANFDYYGAIQLARAVGAPFVAQAGASLLGSRGLAAQPDSSDWTVLDPEFDARWAMLRSSPSAPYLGLVLPSILLRLPYGAKSDAIETFAFEELPSLGHHEAFLWGNAAFACALVIARDLEAEAGASDAGNIAGLPAFAFDTEEGPRLQPCAEVA